LLLVLLLVLLLLVLVLLVLVLLLLVLLLLVLLLLLRRRALLLHPLSSGSPGLLPPSTPSIRNPSDSLSDPRAHCRSCGADAVRRW
jgi:hypothetical protein